MQRCVAINSFKVAPLLEDKELLVAGTHGKGITINSGIANICKGKKGMEETLKIKRITAVAYGISDKEIVVMSAGVIGKQLPMDGMEKVIKDSLSSLSTEDSGGATFAAQTTYLVRKR